MAAREQNVGHFGWDLRHIRPDRANFRTHLIKTQTFLSALAILLGFNHLISVECALWFSDGQY